MDLAETLLVTGAVGAGVFFLSNCGAYLLMKGRQEDPNFNYKAHEKRFEEGRDRSWLGFVRYYLTFEGRDRAYRDLELAPRKK